MTTTTTKAQPISSTGVANLLLKGNAIASITSAPDGTFGWRTFGRVALKDKAGEEKMGYKFKKGFADFETAVAAAIVYLRRHFTMADADLSVGEYIAPERKGFGGGRKLEDSPAFQNALATVAKFKLPPSVQRVVYQGEAPAKPTKKPASEKAAVKAPATKAAATKAKPAKAS